MHWKLVHQPSRRDAKGLARSQLSSVYNTQNIHQRRVAMSVYSLWLQQENPPHPSHWLRTGSANIGRFVGIGKEASFRSQEKRDEGSGI